MRRPTVVVRRIEERLWGPNAQGVYDLLEQLTRLPGRSVPRLPAVERLSAPLASAGRPGVISQIPLGTPPASDAITAAEAAVDAVLCSLERAWQPDDGGLRRDAERRAKRIAYVLVIRGYAPKGDLKRECDEY